MVQKPAQTKATATPTVPARLAEHVPRPTLRFRRQAWADFQRALDPLARTKPFRFGRRF